MKKETPDTTCTAVSSAPNRAQCTAPGVNFNELRSAYAQQGHKLHSTTAPDGSTSYWAERWGLVRYLPTLHDAALFLAQIGGRL